jgi:hypothetical protein
LSHLLALLAELKPTPNRTNLSSTIQICIYHSRSNKNEKTSKNETTMIVSRVASESIRNTKKLKNIIKTETKYTKTMKQHPNILDMLKYTARNENNREKANFKS